MTAKDFKIISARINDEIENIEALISELQEKSLYNELTGLQENKFFLRSTGSILHDFYVAVENTLKIVCSEIDEKLPDGSEWHLLLLKQATYNIPEIRPAIISKKTMDKLDKYRAFRHVFRNVYGFNLDAVRIKELVLELPDTIDLFKDDIKKFQNLLEEI